MQLGETYPLDSTWGEVCENKHEDRHSTFAGREFFLKIKKGNKKEKENDDKRLAFDWTMQMVAFSRNYC